MARGRLSPRGQNLGTRDQNRGLIGVLMLQVPPPKVLILQESETHCASPKFAWSNFLEMSAVAHCPLFFFRFSEDRSESNSGPFLSFCEERRLPAPVSTGMQICFSSEVSAPLEAQWFSTAQLRHPHWDHTCRGQPFKMAGTAMVEFQAALSFS